MAIFVKVPLSHEDARKLRSGDSCLLSGVIYTARDAAHKRLCELVAQGKSIIMISSELPEVLRMSDRVLVMCEGRKTGELDIAEATQENIMQLATMREEN